MNHIKLAACAAALIALAAPAWADKPGTIKKGLPLALSGTWNGANNGTGQLTAEALVKRVTYNHRTASIELAGTLTSSIGTLTFAGQPFVAAAFPSRTAPVTTTAADESALAAPALPEDEVSPSAELPAEAQGAAKAPDKPGKDKIEEALPEPAPDLAATLPAAAGPCAGIALEIGPVSLKEPRIVLDPEPVALAALPQGDPLCDLALAMLSPTGERDIQAALKKLTKATGKPE